MSVEISPLTSLDVAKCSRNGSCEASLTPQERGPGLYACRSHRCGRPLRETFVDKAGRQLEDWRQARWRAGEVLTLGAMSEEVLRRWPVLSIEQAHQVVAAADRWNHDPPHSR